MQYVDSWTTKDRRILLHFSQKTLNSFHLYAQKDENDSEAGGLLLGSVHGANLLINNVTEPTVWDKRTRYLFERMPLVHDAIALSLWTKSRGITRYLGEWHTHPEDHPKPSFLDRSEWNKLSCCRKDKRPFLAVIVGRKSLYVELVYRSGQGIILNPMIEN